MRVLGGLHRRAAAIVLGTSGLMLLSNCATLGGNVRGSFSCAAPDGTCAPSAAIDDRALAAIAEGGDEGGFIPAAVRPGFDEGGRSRVARAQAVRPAPGDPARTRERVLRIVFQPYIDERGRLHEATAVHAVVESGDWQQAFAQRPHARGDLTGLVSLADAVDRADLPQDAVAPGTGGFPAPEAVAAARARKADPNGALQTGVSDRSAPEAMRAPVSAVPSTSSAPRDVSAGRGPELSAAADDPKSDPALRAAMGSVGRGAAAAVPPGGQAASASPMIRAPGFPASVARDD